MSKWSGTSLKVLGQPLMKHWPTINWILPFRDLPPIIGKANGLDTQLLVPTARGITNYLAVRSDLPIKNFSELKGKRVGLLRGTADELSFVSALNSQGLKLSDVRVVNLDFNAVNAALAAKKLMRHGDLLDFLRYVTNTSLTYL